MFNRNMSEDEFSALLEITDTDAFDMGGQKRGAALSVVDLEII